MGVQVRDAPVSAQLLSLPLEVRTLASAGAAIAPYLGKTTGLPLLLARLRCHGHPAAAGSLGFVHPRPLFALHGMALAGARRAASDALPAARRVMGRALVPCNPTAASASSLARA